MNELYVQKVQNGYLVQEGFLGTQNGGTCTRQWVFETPAALAHFVESWGNGVVE